MKLFTFLLFSFIIFSSHSFAQNEIASADQNPRYLVSKAKYEMLADSINRFHSTTLQNTYEAYDWYEARQKRRSDRTSFRRQLRLESIRYGDNWGYNDYNYRWNNNYYNGWNNRYRYNNRWNNRRHYDAVSFLFFNNWCW